MLIEHNHSLKADNTFGIDARCREYVAFGSEDEAADIARRLGAADEPFLLLGGGSNLLLTRDFPGIVVTPEKRFDVAPVPSHDPQAQRLRCWAGTTFDDVVACAIDRGLYGLENLSLIPGECGASAVQNIGAYGAEAKDVIETVEAVEIGTGRKVSFAAEECGYAYRQSKFKGEWHDKYIITYVTYRLSTAFVPRLDYGNIRAELQRQGISEDSLSAAQLRQTVIDIRRHKLPAPAVTGNAGSFFMNPIVDEATFQKLKAAHPDLRYFPMGEGDYKIPAGWMIEQCGWKGRSLGRAAVHDKQALVLVNKGGATGEEVVKLMEAVRHDVRERFGLDIKPEVNIV